MSFILRFTLDGVNHTAVVLSPETSSMSDEQLEKDFKQLIARATNTWDTMPEWVRTVSDALADNPPTAVKYL